MNNARTVGKIKNTLQILSDDYIGITCFAVSRSIFPRTDWSTISLASDTNLELRNNDVATQHRISETLFERICRFSRSYQQALPSELFGDSRLSEVELLLRRHQLLWNPK